MPKGFSRKEFWCVAAVAAVAVALAGCDVMVSSMHRGNGSANETWTRSYALAANGEVEVIKTNGKIEIEAGDSAKVDVRAERTARSSTDDAARKLLDETPIREDVTADRVRLDSKSQH